MSLIESDVFKKTKEALRTANAETARYYPGDPLGRQPVHTMYGGAHLFRADTAKRMSEAALKAVHDFAPDPTDMAAALGLSSGLAGLIHARVVDKLKREAVEDFRIDFEDGYGNRSDAEEDGHAQSAAKEVAAGFELGSLPPYIGIRIKTFSDELFPRAVRTLDIFLTTLLAATGGKLPSNFVVTLPKITSIEQVAALTRLLGAFEASAKLPLKSLRFEIMVETPQSIVLPTGQAALPLLVAASDGRCLGAHFGTYDYTASHEITALHQAMSHPACDFARQMMKISLAGSGVMLSDGATNVMPVGPHKETLAAPLTASQREENKIVVYRAWRTGYEHVRQSLKLGFYQGWDLHPAQLPVRYAATYAFFLEGLDEAAKRLRAFTDKAAQATLMGDVFDDAATGQGLLNFFLRGVACGAITPEEAAATGLTMAEIGTRSFLKILQGRRK